MVGTCTQGGRAHYPVEPLAARYRGSVEVATDSPREAYAGQPPIRPGRSPWPLSLDPPMTRGCLGAVGIGIEA